MTISEEHKAWLSANEWNELVHLIDDEPDVVVILRTLAETRSALARVDPTKNAAGTCDVCEGTWEHRAGCIYLTMPRPK